MNYYSAVGILSNRADFYIVKSASTYGIAKEDILSKSRKGVIPEARHYAMYMLRWELMMTVVDIAKVLNLKDHSAVVKGIRNYEVKRHENRLTIDVR